MELAAKDPAAARITRTINAEKAEKSKLDLPAFACFPCGPHHPVYQVL
ncbi:hypothetical protein JOC55_000717 [Paenibacillus sacheonensis]|nr:hypothetical protein [Paenibacillus sacheonensis]